MLRIRLPGIKKPDEIRPRVFTSMPVLVLPGHVWQAGSMTGKLSQCYPTDITSALQLGDIFGDWVIQAQLALFNSLRKQRGREHLSDGPEIEDCVGRNRSILSVVSHAVIEELGIAIHPNSDRNASSPTLWQYGLNLLRDDLLNIDLGVRGTNRKQSSYHSCNDDVCSDHGVQAIAAQARQLSDLTQQFRLARFTRTR